jgi:L-alanine-DL-glutamate epimerase-like enolase superfamily enzyme
MQITKVDTFAVPLDVASHTTAVPSVPNRRWEAVFVRIEAADGTVGASAASTFSSAAAQASIISRYLAPLVVGSDASQIGALWQLMLEADRPGFGTAQLGHGAIDVALWDLWGRIAGLPVYKLLGAVRNQIRAYASTLTYKDVEAYLSFVEELLGRGFTAVKLHCWGDPKRDIALCQAVRTFVGDGVDLMLDPVGAYDRAGASRVGRALDELGFRWFEEPLPESDLDGIRDLRQRIATPVIGGETYELQDYPTYLRSGAYDALRPDVSYMRGITAVKKAAAVCETFGMACELHNFDPALMQAANLHVSASIPNCTYLEIPVPVGVMDRCVVTGIGVDSDGLVSVPEGPGLGLEVDWSAVEDLAIYRDSYDAAP